jgi:hypothetical protein
VRRADHLYRGVLPSVMCLAECDREASTLRRSRPTTAVEPLGGGGGKEIATRPSC